MPFNLPQFTGGGLFSRSWAQPRQRAPFGALPQHLQPFMSNPMFRAADARQQMPLMSYLPLLMSRGLFGGQGQPMAPPMSQPSFTPAQPAAPMAPSNIQQAAQTFQAANPAPQMFTPTPPVQSQPQQMAPAAPAWQPASWFADPNSAARRIAAQSWGNLPLQQQQQFMIDTYGGSGAWGVSPIGSSDGQGGMPGNDFGLGFGIDTAAGIY